MKNIKLTLEYDGTRYHGWQSQAGSGQPTIQDTLGKALAKVANGEIKTHSSGRTDAGVHAFGHVVNFHTDRSLPPDAWAPALNHELPPDIRVLDSCEVPSDFHARYSALSKIYRYRVLNRHSPTALFRNRAWHINVPLQFEAMQQAASALVGRHDFSAFRSSGCTAKSPIRSIRTIDMARTGDLIDISMEADAFLQYMARNIAGTLVEVGLGRFSPEDVVRILSSRDRSLAGRTAPPQGLYLVTVFYS
jgi:tRNA pseudouridine38-40 synthase